MRRKALIVTFVALAAAVAGIVVAAAAAGVQVRRPVVVTATCPTGEQGPLSVSVNPWTVVLNQGENTRWQLNINNSNDNRIVVEAKSDSGWPYPDRRVSGQSAAEASDMNANAAGSYSYDITIYCGEDAVVIDPKMRVGG